MTHAKLLFAALSVLAALVGGARSAHADPEGTCIHLVCRSGYTGCGCDDLECCCQHDFGMSCSEAQGGTSPAADSGGGLIGGLLDWLFTPSPPDPVAEAAARARAEQEAAQRGADEVRARAERAAAERQREDNESYGRELGAVYDELRRHLSEASEATKPFARAAALSLPVRKATRCPPDNAWCIAQCAALHAEVGIRRGMWRYAGLPRGDLALGTATAPTAAARDAPGAAALPGCERFATNGGLGGDPAATAADAERIAAAERELHIAASKLGGLHKTSGQLDKELADARENNRVNRLQRVAELEKVQKDVAAATEERAAAETAKRELDKRIQRERLAPAERAKLLAEAKERLDKAAKHEQALIEDALAKAKVHQAKDDEEQKDIERAKKKLESAKDEEQRAKEIIAANVAAQSAAAQRLRAPPGWVQPPDLPGASWDPCPANPCARRPDGFYHCEIIQPTAQGNVTGWVLDQHGACQ